MAKTNATIHSAVAAAMVVVGGLLVAAPGFWLPSYAAMARPLLPDASVPLNVHTVIALFHGLVCVGLGCGLIRLGVSASQRAPGDQRDQR